MKRLAYISTMHVGAGSPNFSKQMMEILNKARLVNKQLDVTGILLVAGNHVLQVLEGDGQKLAQLMYKIGRDKRHQDVSVVLNTPCTDRLFPSWHMRLLSQGSAAYQLALGELNKHYENDFRSVSALDKQRLNTIFNEISSANHSPKVETSANQPEHDYQRKVLYLNSWPKPSELRMTSDMINLCCRLNHHKHAYETLCAARVCQSETALIQNLTSLDKLGLLNTTAANDPMKATPKTDAAKGDRFSQILRKFITSTRT